MMPSAAHERHLLPSGARSYISARVRLSGSVRTVGGWRTITLGMVTGMSWFLPVAAQTTSPQVRAEFRTAPRSLITQTVDRSRAVTARGAVHREVATAQDLGALNPSAQLEHMQLVLQRPRERQAAFDAEVIALHQSGGPSYHQWLTPEVIGAEFGPSASDIATLTRYLQSEGFTVAFVGKSGMFVDFSGTVAQVQQSFHAEIHNLRLATGEVRYSAVNEAQLPEALTPLVASFIPISNIAPHPLIVPAPPRSHSPGIAGLLADGLPNNTGGGAYDVGAQDFYTIYNEMPLISAGTVTGSGITIALLEQTDINPNDVIAFRTMMGVNPATPAGSLTPVHGAGSISCSDPNVNGDEDEAVLDTEWAGAVAPGATLLFMSCNSVHLSAEAVIDNNLATTMSLSYGLTEGGNQGATTLFSDLWEQAAAQGETVVVSAGDAGSANTLDQGNGVTIASNGLAVNALASSPYDVAAGGTDFQDVYNQDEGSSFNIVNYWNPSNGANYSSALSYIAETTWNDTCASSIRSYDVENAHNNPNAASDPYALCDDSANRSSYLKPIGGGGGVSIWEARPTWQNGTVYGLNVAPISTYTNRLLPDISLFASNGDWGHALDFYQSDTSGSLQRAGGTSFVAPQLAGLFALIAQKTGERLGQPNFVLYNMAGVEFGTTSYTGGCNGSGASGIGTTTSPPAGTCIFYDIQTSNNAVACTPGSANCYTQTGSDGILSTGSPPAVNQIAYPSLQGYDLATGIGSVNITNLVNKWQTVASGGITFTPTVTVTSTAASYTYGSPSAITYTATVSGSGSFPTGSVTFSGSPTISTMGNDPLVPSSCNSGGTCTESATQAYTPPGNLAARSYTITGAYLTTNENYSSGSGTTGLTVNKQTPTVAVNPVTIAVGTATANFSATVSYVGSGVAPSGGLNFSVQSGTAVAATCTGPSSPLTCTYTGYNTSALAVGSYTLTATSIADGNYATASGSNTLKVKPLPTIVFTVPTHHTMDTPFTVSASSNSSGAITYSVVSGPATIVGSTVTLTGVANTVVLKTSQAPSASFAAGTQTASFPVIAGSVWFGNGTGSLSTFDLTGTPITGTSGFTGAGVGTIASPLGLAFDASGNVWVASTNGVSEFTRQGVAVTSTPYTVGGIGNPLAIAVDGAGQIWAANSAGTVSVLSNAGAAVSPSTGYSGPGSKPAGIAIDISGNVWIPSNTANTVTRILGVAAPVVPLATGAANGPGAQP
jgi:subtilase family serine protease